MKPKIIFLGVIISFILSAGAYLLIMKFNFYQYTKSDCCQEIKDRLKQNDKHRELAQEYFHETGDISRPEHAEREFNQILEYKVDCRQNWISNNAFFIYASSFAPFIVYLFLTFLFLVIWYRKKFSAKEIIKYCFKSGIFYFVTFIFLGLLIFFVIRVWNNFPHS